MSDPKHIMSDPKHIMLVAGEASGDLHGAHLIHELKHQDPTLTFSGLGGQKMQDAGMRLDEDLTKLAVVGFVEVLKHYGQIKRIFNAFLKSVEEKQPACVILIDYPGFNLRLAKELKKLNIKVIYYISPQVWAWKENRVHHIKRDVERMLVLFSFEKDFYARHKIDVSFVGHPLIDIVKPSVSKEDFLSSIEMAEYRMTIGLLPGSRVKEIEAHLPVMIEASGLLHKEFPMLQFLIIKAPTIDQKLIDEMIDLYQPSFPFKIVDGQTYDAINSCDICMVTSGTATLETALLLKPMVIIYKTSLLTWLLAKMLIKIKSIGLVNIVAGKKVVPECIQFDANSKEVAKQIKNIFTNEIRVSEIKDELRQVKALLGDSGASLKAAQEVLRLLSS
jgi:lipid-A-disaccharide synthase